MSDYPKYQYSVFLKNGRDEQIVIRADDFEEFKELKKQADAIVSVVNKKVGDVTDSKVVCEAHDIEMKKRKSKKTGKVYWAHWNKDNQPCFGKGFVE